MAGKAVECRVDGLSELEDALLNQTTKKARSGMRAALEAAGEFMRVLIALRAPSRTGRLARGITKKITLSARNDEGTVSVGPSKEDFYAQFDEFGSIHNKPPEPFIRPAWDEGNTKMLEVFANKLKEVLGL